MVDARPERVEYYSPEAGMMVESEREYIKVSEITGEVTEDYGYGYPHGQIVRLSLYLDAETGLVVWDVEAYERSRHG